MGRPQDPVSATSVPRNGQPSPGGATARSIKAWYRAPSPDTLCSPTLDADRPRLGSVLSSPAATLRNSASVSTCEPTCRVCTRCRYIISPHLIRTSSQCQPVMPSPLLLVFVAGAVLYGLLLTRRKRHALRLPPGPPADPLLGHLRIMPSKNPHETFYAWSKQYGDVMYLEVLGKPIVVLSSEEAATDLLDKRSANYSDRPSFPIYQRSARMCPTTQYNPPAADCSVFPAGSAGAISWPSCPTAPTTVSSAGCSAARSTTQRSPSTSPSRSRRPTSSS